MTTLLIRNATILVTMDDQRREIHGGGLFIRNGFIEQVGESADLPAQADDSLDLDGHIVFPGLVNTHHHFYQTLTRVVPAAQNANLFTWLKTLYPIWARMQPEDIFLSAQLALAELALSGCTTASDHLYLFPNGSNLDDEIAAAGEVVRSASGIAFAQDGGSTYVLTNAHVVASPTATRSAPRRLWRAPPRACRTRGWSACLSGTSTCTRAKSSSRSSGSRSSSWPTTFSPDEPERGGRLQNDLLAVRPSERSSAGARHIRRVLG